jgi:hypothetical protein
MHNFHIGPTLFLLKTPTYLNGLSETKQFIRLVEIMSTYLGLTLTLTVTDNGCNFPIIYMGVIYLNDYYNSVITFV